MDAEKRENLEFLENELAKVTPKIPAAEAYKLLIAAMVDSAGSGCVQFAFQLGALMGTEDPEWTNGFLNWLPQAGLPFHADAEDWVPVVKLCLPYEKETTHGQRN